MREFKIEWAQNGFIATINYPYTVIKIYKTFEEAIDFIEEVYSETIADEKKSNKKEV